MAKVEVACLVTIFRLAECSLMGELAAVEPTVLSVPTEGSQTWQEMESVDLPQWKTRLAGLKGHTYAYTHIYMCTRLQSEAFGDFH